MKAGASQRSGANHREEKEEEIKISTTAVQQLPPRRRGRGQGNPPNRRGKEEVGRRAPQRRFVLRRRRDLSFTSFAPFIAIDAHSRIGAPSHSHTLDQRHARIPRLAAAESNRQGVAKRKSLVNLWLLYS